MNEKGSDFLRLLRPAWWVARGYLVAMTLTSLASHDSVGLLPRVGVGNPAVAGRRAGATPAPTPSPAPSATG